MTSNSNIRTRFAPSPTGYLHVGGVRTLLFNWLYARKTGGKMILRVENTDQVRSSPENERMMLEDVADLGFDVDEGPNPKNPDESFGPHKPYRQSDRLKVYADHVHTLLEQGKAYYCFCPAELIGQKREAALKMGKMPIYDGTCTRLSKEEVEKKFKAGEKAGVRFKTPNKNFTLRDEVRGDVEFRAGTVGDFLLTRTPTEGEATLTDGIGMPVYNFCCVIDDHLMEMTHIIRGEDHLSNTARQLMIYDAFDWKLPQFAHIAMVLGADKQKLSKRNGDTSARDYTQKGYLSEALINFLALLGWWPPNDFKPASGHPEILSREELIQTFNLGGLQKAPAVFDVTKLNWMNSFYLKYLPLEQIAQRARPFFEASDSQYAKEFLSSRSEADFLAAIDLLRTEAVLLSDFPKLVEEHLSSNPTLDDQALGALKEGTAKQVVETFEAEFLKGTAPLSEDEVGVLQKTVAKITGLKGKPLFMAIRAVTTGRGHGPEIKKLLPLIGRENVKQRMIRFKKEAGL